MSTIELLQVIEDDRRRQAERSTLIRLARRASTGRIHRRSFPERVGRWLRGA
jgi:hypothetical protein